MQSNPLFVYQPLIEKARERFQQWEDENFVGGDASMIPILKSLNTLEGVATLFSCEGHTRQEDGYIMMLLTREGFETFSRLHSYVFSNMLLLYGPRAMFGRLDFRMAISVFDPTFRSMYPTVTLRLEMPKKMRRAWFAQLRKAIKLHNS